MSRRNATVIAGVSLLAALWFFALGPRQLGGPVTYVITSGNSMEPGINSGDLVLARESADYDVGDIVAYDSPDVKKTILHRVIDREGDTFVLRGDNNDWIDSHTPTGHEIYGKQWIHVPGVGKIVEWLRSPIGLAAVAGLVMLALFGGSRAAGQSRGQSRSRSGSTPAGSGRQVTASSDFVPLVQRLERIWPDTGSRSVAAVAVGSVVMGLVLFAMPATRSVPREVTYFHQGRFAYQATAPEGAVYEDGRLETGDPVFRSLIDRFDVEFEYDFNSEAAAEIQGTGRLDVEISDHFGWSRTIPLDGGTSFAGDEAVLRGTIDAAALGELTARVEEETGTSPGKYRLVVRPHIDIDGTVAGQEVDDVFEPELAFLAETPMLRIDDETPEIENTIEPSADGTVRLRAEVANALPLPFLRPPVGLARSALAGGGLLALVLSVRLGVNERRRGHMSERERIQARYGRWILPVTDADLRSGQTVQLESFEALTEIATRFEMPVLHDAGGGVDTYAVRDGDVWYVYQLAGGESPPREPRRPSSATEPVIESHEPVNDGAALEVPGWVSDGMARLQPEPEPESEPVESRGVVRPEPPRLPPEEEVRVRRAVDELTDSRRELFLAKARVEGMLDQMRREREGRE